MKKLLYVIAAALCLVACEGNTPDGGYVDLGLTSGTKWKAVNELNPQDRENGFYTYDEAVAAFGKNLPTEEQWKELVNECTWKWTGKGGYKVIGTNGKSITLPPAGSRSTDGVTGVGSCGDYWSSKPCPWDSERALGLSFAWNGEPTGYYDICSYGRSVRLVK